MSKRTFLGLDCSTQSLTALLIRQDDEANPASTRIILEKSLNFDETFPEFGTRNGVLPGRPGEAHTPPQLWVKALETLLKGLREDGVDFASIAAIATSGQQHASVYLNAAGGHTLTHWQGEKGLAEQLEGGYSRATSPIWMDATTSQQCREITETLGGPAAVCALTGSECFERFTGPQIRKFAQENPKAYAETRHILLVSSFIPSLLAGQIVGIDPGDGAGMNLMDLSKSRWDGRAMVATASNLDLKLAPVIASDTVVGPIDPWFCRRFGFAADCRILPGTGDNPSSLVGLGLISRGRIGVSLGTSDVLFAHLTEPKTDPSGSSHVFGSPTGTFMALCVYKNGSLAREAVRKTYGLTWDRFSQILAETRPGNDGRILLPYFDTEIIPRIAKAGVKRIGLAEDDAAGHVRGVVEAQMMSMRLHSEWMGEKPSAISATGGASQNAAILKIMADVFGVPVSRQETAAAAALGAAVRAQHGYLKAVGKPASWESLTDPHLKPSFTVEPDPEAHRVYGEMAKAYAKAEADHLSQLNR